MIRTTHSAAPVWASAIVGAAYMLGAVVFAAVSDGPAVAVETDPVNLAVTIDPPAYDIPRPAPVAADDVPGMPVEQTVETAQPAMPVILAPIVEDRPRIALVIDDVGLDLDAAARVTDIPAALTIAVLPYAPASVDVAHGAGSAGHDVLVHMPMEPLGLADPGPNALRVGLDDDDLQARTLWAFARVPGAVGLNNHMGSRFTQDPGALRAALLAVSDEALFLDSKTVPGSRGAAVARGLDMPVLERDVFLDHVIDPRQIVDQLAAAEELARTRGWAVAIGHPHDETLDALEDWLPGAEARGVEFVTVTTLSEILGRDGRGEVRTSALQ